MLLRIALIAVVFFFTHIPAHAVIDMFLLVEGVPGESRDSAHLNQCDVLAWSWGMSGCFTPRITSPDRHHLRERATPLAPS